MKIGIVSDLHLNAHGEYWKQIVSNIHQQSKQCDLLINAGDISEYQHVRDYFTLNSCDCELFEVNGNHDYYFNLPGRTLETKIFGGLKFVLATLWTNFGNNYSSELFSEKNISDFFYIKNFRTIDATNFYNEAIAFIEQQKPDVLVTHFGVHPNSVSPRFKSDYASILLNSYFVNDLTSTIKNVKPKLIVHGHTHDSFDYMLDDTRVVCNPLGYPRERYNILSDYQVKIIEMK